MLFFCFFIYASYKYSTQNRKKTKNRSVTTIRIKSTTTDKSNVRLKGRKKTPNKNDFFFAFLYVTFSFYGFFRLYFMRYIFDYLQCIGLSNFIILNMLVQRSSCYTVNAFKVAIKTVKQENQTLFVSISSEDDTRNFCSEYP